MTPPGCLEATRCHAAAQMRYLGPHAFKHIHLLIGRHLYLQCKRGKTSRSILEGNMPACAEPLLCCCPKTCSLRLKSLAMQVLLLLKSSDRVMHDICHAFDACPAPPSAPVRHSLTLRKWIALKPERELRCFVRQRDLVGLCRSVLGVSFFVTLLLLLARETCCC